MTREWGYTALSRAREGTQVYLVGGEPMRELVAAELGGRHASDTRDPLQDLARDLERSTAQSMSIDLEL